jgi:hypothetical protein
VLCTVTTALHECVFNLLSPLSTSQVNDDTIIKTPNWAPQLVNTLASNPSIPNFGVTGPSDTNNGKIFTHSFVHRTHFEVFGHLFPPYFKNWWSDDWITTVYGAEHTFRNDDVQIEHNTNAQKSNGIMRYTVDQVRFRSKTQPQAIP